MEPEKILHFQDDASGLDGFLVIHTLRFGPAFGGIRIWRYPNEDACVSDARRLAEAMTYKCLVNDIPGAGGKIVIRQERLKRRADALKIVARIINEQEGKFYSGTDVGVSRDDVRVLGEYTTFLSCDDLSEAATQGVLHALKAVRPDLKGLKVAIQGLGAVGGKLARLLFKEGANLVVTDILRENCKEIAKELRAEIVPPDEIFSVRCDVFAPCALGGVLNANTVEKLACEVVCGAANNQLESEGDAQRLHERGILYIPDFLANSGGAVQGCWRILKGDGDYSADLAKIGERVQKLVEVARARRISPDRAAREKVLEKLGA